MSEELPRRITVLGGLILMSVGAAVMGLGDGSGAMSLVAGALIVAFYVKVRE